MDCLISTRIAGPCDTCNAHADPAHLIEGELAIYCAACCKACHPKMREWDGQPATVGGEQGRLW